MGARDWRRGGDHYYWLTAYLASHDLQRRTSRAIAGSIFGLGVISVILSFGVLGPHSVGGRVAQIVVAACCVVMAWVWLRPKWPSRRVSQATAVVGTVCIAVSCVMVSSPVVGILGATAYAALGSLVALLHSMRLLAFIWAVGAGVIVYLAVQLAEDDVSVALATALLVVLVNGFAVFASRLVIRLIANDTIHGDLEPVTGLFTRDGFYEQVATLIGARSRNDDRRLVVVVVNLDNHALLADMHGAARAIRVRVAIARSLRETARRGAAIAHPSDSEFWVADLFTQADPHPLAERIRGGVAGAHTGVTASVGVVCTPLAPLAALPSHDVMEELLTIAQTAMFEARRAGGNQTRTAIDPALTVLEEPSSEPGWETG
ncbi:GGDEF domain-containing protein [Mycolicibacterium sp. 624]|uniref:GGDEF domain-containing protein n=1 Tax=Mycolicibacterium sp. 624 TaxID=3156314 RepID=UPI00339417F4